MDAVWWSADARRVIFWNLDKRNGSESVLYAWSLVTGKISVLLRPFGDIFYSCSMSADRLMCLRQTGTQPTHVAAINTHSGAIRIVANVNPELNNIRFGKVERIEWEVPSMVPNLYPPRAFGYILFPPDFDTTRKNPVFIAPYSASGFHRGDVGDEHPLFVYAASGIHGVAHNFPVCQSAGDDKRRLGQAPLFAETRLSISLYHDEVDLSRTRSRDGARIHRREARGHRRSQPGVG